MVDKPLVFPFSLLFSFFFSDCDVYTHEQLQQCAFCVMNDISTLEGDDEDASSSSSLASPVLVPKKEEK